MGQNPPLAALTCIRSALKSPRHFGVIVMLYAYVFPQFIPHGLNFIH